MSDSLVYVPGNNDNFVTLSRTPSGKLFKKQILSVGPLYYPGVAGGSVDIDEDFLTKLADNFKNKVCPIVQVPVVDDNNSHSEDPFRNIGEVIDLQVEGGKAYAIIDARDEDAAAKVGKTLLGASAMLSLDYTDTKTNSKVGPTLLHVAVTNRPFVNDLEDFEEVLLSHDSSTEGIVLLSASAEDDQKIEESPMDLDELIAVALSEHGIDIPALQQKAAEAETYAKLSDTLQSSLTDSGVLKLSNTEEGEAPSAEDIVSAVADLAQSRLELSAKVDSLVADNKQTKAETRVDELVRDGFITPAKRDSQIKLLLSNPELFEELLPEQPVVELSAESGKNLKEEEHDETVSSEIARLSSVFDEVTGKTVKA